MNIKSAIVFSALFLGLVTCILGLNHQVTTLKAMYERDTELAYRQGVKHGIAQAIDVSPDVEALTVLFSRYPKANAHNFARWVVEACATYRVPQLILAGMVMQESSCNPNAVSGCGAKGLTQIRWKFWGAMLKKMGIAEKESDLFNPRISIEAGACIVRYLLDRYDNNIHEALRHYSGSATRYTDKVLGRVLG